MGEEILPLQWPSVMPWLMGAVGVMAIIYLAFSTVIAGRKLFGKHPPMDEQLETLDRSLRKQITDGDKQVANQVESLREDFEEQFDELAVARRDHDRVLVQNFKELGEKLGEQTHELTSAAQRRTDTINEKITDLAVAIGKLDERTEKLKAL